jgi:D-alanyl-D-alanine carboxypeptidase/D-alanyl-D-alanine-endopeptidase (penicillin-binding protein 4)
MRKIACRFFFFCLLGCLSHFGAAADSTETLRRDLDRIFSDHRFADAQWGVKIVSLDRSETLFEKNPLRLYIPASNNKIITTAAALICLGPEFRYETRVLTDGPIEDGTLRGNLIVRGGGDPSNSTHFQPDRPFSIFIDWAAKLKERNIHAIDGEILGDTGAFDENKFGKGWEWDDLVQAYAAPISALQFNDNSIAVEIAPRSRRGLPARIQATPLADYLDIENETATEEAGSPASLRIKPGDSIESIVISGAVPLEGSAVTRAVAVQSPVRYFLTALRYVLSEQGIDTLFCGIREKKNYASPALKLQWIHFSPELSEILKPLLKESQNLYAETLTRTLGYSRLGKGTFDNGRKIVEETLEKMGVEKGSYLYADASGLSRLNLASADILVRILEYMFRHRYFESFYNALAIAGVDGTLENRLKETRAQNNLHAKTGTISNVSAISGYLRTSDGEMLAFSMIANNFLVATDIAEQVQNRALERLARFSRK